MNIPNVSVAIDIISAAGVRLGARGSTGAVSFDVKAKLEEKERRSQMVVVNFSLFLTTKPSVVKFEVDGTATLTGKDEEINKMLEVDPDIKVPYVFQKVYQNAFEAMYLLSTILKTPSPPHNLFPRSQRERLATEDIDVESTVGRAMMEENVEQRPVESSSVENKKPATEDHETVIADVDAESGVSETRSGDGVEEKAGGLTRTES